MTVTYFIYKNKTKRTFWTWIHSAFVTEQTIVWSIAYLAVCCSISTPARSQSAADSTVNTIRAMYEKGAYIAAEVEARRYLEQQPRVDSLCIVAEQYLAFALVAQGKAKTAIMHFSAILALDSTFELDPIYTSPKILASFNEAKQHKRVQPRDEPERTLQRSQDVPASVSWRSLVFPGWEQVHQGRDVKGYALLGLGVAAAGITIAFEIERSNARSEYLAATTPDRAVSEYDRYNRLNKSAAYSLIACAAIYFYSEIDAYLNLPHTDGVTFCPNLTGLQIAIRL